jgi:catechol 2,3-dioxygenase-like lactoylglutathione lyase family enzyme
MELGTFSTSLAVRDLEASRAFYEKLGFTAFHGETSQGWLMLRNGDVDTFTDVRELQRRLRDQGIALTSEADETTTGPASFTIVDPDGNPILFDQHR